MTLTTDILRTWFRQFNADYFGDELPEPRLALSKARTRLGTMTCKCTRRMLKRVYSDFTIRISIYYDCTEREFQETLLHEMIHYYIVYKRIPDTSSHGSAFRGMMNRLNSQYGWNISVSSSMHGRRPSGSLGGKATNRYVVLALVLNNGDRMLSVVSLRSVRRIDQQVKSVKAIADYCWYITNDNYFMDFPKVRSLRARRVPREVYDEKTAAMQPLFSPT